MFSKLPWNVNKELYEVEKLISEYEPTVSLIKNSKQKTRE